MAKQVNNAQRDFFSHLGLESEAATVMLNVTATNSKAALYALRKMFSLTF